MNDYNELEHQSDEIDHWDPLTDVHVDHTEMANIQRQVFDKIPGSFA